MIIFLFNESHFPPPLHLFLPFLNFLFSHSFFIYPSQILCLSPPFSHHSLSSFLLPCLKVSLHLSHLTNPLFALLHISCHHIFIVIILVININFILITFINFILISFFSLKSWTCSSLFSFIIMSCRQHGYPWPSLATSPYHSSPLAGLQGYILCPHIVAVCKLELVVLLLHGHMWGSIGVHHLWARPCFSSSVQRVWFV